MKRILIAGTNSGCGKTTITMGLMAAFSEDNVVQPFKVGPDYIDPAFHSYITKRCASNLDSWLLSEEELIDIFYRNSNGADISIVEGVMGLHDGFGIEKDNGSTAHVSKILDIPVLLVINGKALSLSAAAMVKGYKEFDSSVNFTGVIINNITSEKHYHLLKDSIELHTGVPVVGYLNTNESFSLDSRHLGLVPSVETKNLDKKIICLKNEIKKTIDLQLIEQLAEVEWTKNINIEKTEICSKNNVRIGIAKDEAFNFYYEDSLNILKKLGVELVKFSPINDQSIPKDLAAIYIGGGFPEVFSEQLSKNIEMQKSIREELSKGIPYLAECGGLMYLSQGIKNLDGTYSKMAGWFNFDCEMTKRLQRFGYNEVTLKRDSILGEKGNVIRTHEFHRSRIIETNQETLFKIKKNTHYETREWECGFIKGNGIAGYPHFHFGANKNFASKFIQSAETYKAKRCSI